MKTINRNLLNFAINGIFAFLLCFVFTNNAHADCDPLCTILPPSITCPDNQSSVNCSVTMPIGTDGKVLEMNGHKCCDNPTEIPQPTVPSNPVGPVPPTWGFPPPAAATNTPVPVAPGRPTNTPVPLAPTVPGATRPPAPTPRCNISCDGEICGDVHGSCTGNDLTGCAGGANKCDGTSCKKCTTPGIKCDCYCVPQGFGCSAGGGSWGTINLDGWLLNDGAPLDTEAPYAGFFAVTTSRGGVCSGGITTGGGTYIENVANGQKLTGCNDLGGGDGLRHIQCYSSPDNHAVSDRGGWVYGLGADGWGTDPDNMEFCVRAKAGKFECVIGCDSNHGPKCVKWSDGEDLMSEIKCFKREIRCQLSNLRLNVDDYFTKKIGLTWDKNRMNEKPDPNFVAMIHDGTQWSTLPSANNLPNTTTTYSYNAAPGSYNYVVCCNKDGSLYGCTDRVGIEIPAGVHEDKNCQSTWGWTCTASNYQSVLNVDLYSDGDISTGTHQGTYQAGITRTGIAGQCGGFFNHGFSITIPDPLKDATNHTLYTYVKNIGPHNWPLTNTPLTINCLPDPWYKLNGASLYKNGSINNYIPVGTQPYDATDTNQRFIVVRNTNPVSVEGVVLPQGSVYHGDGAEVSTAKWLRHAYIRSNRYLGNLGTFLEYVRARKKFKIISSLDDLEPETINIYTGSDDLIISSTSQIRPGIEKAVIFVEGDLTIDASPTLNNLGRSLAFIATGNINIRSSVRLINGILIANNIDLAYDTPTTNELKINGNLITTNDIDNPNIKRNRADWKKPSLYVTFNQQMYTDLLPYLSTIVREGRQLE